MAIDRYYAKKNYTDEDYERFLDITRSGAVAAYLYCQNVIKNGARFPLSSENGTVRSIGRGGVALLPVSFFVDFLGCEAGDGSLSLGGAKISFKADEGGIFSVAPKMKDGVLYLPAVVAALALGLAAKAYYNGQLIIIGSEEHIRIFI